MKPKIYITVEGGTVTSVSCEPEMDVEVVIIDYDLDGTSEITTTDCVDTGMVMRFTPDKCNIVKIEEFKHEGD